MSADPINKEFEPEQASGPDSEPSQAKPSSIWPLIASMDYLLIELQAVSPMSAHLLRMARQNLLDEHLAEKQREDDPSDA